MMEVKDNMGGGDGARDLFVSPKKIPKKIFFGQISRKIRAFSGKYHVKFGHLVHFSYIDFRAKMSCAPKVD